MSSIRDTDSIVNSAKDPEKKFVADYQPRNETQYEACKIDGTMYPLNGTCPLCGQSRATVEGQFSKYVRI